MIIVKAACLGEQPLALGFKSASHNAYVTEQLNEYPPFYSNLVYANNTFPEHYPFIQFMVDLYAHN